MLDKIVLLGEPKSTQNIYKIACRPYPTIYMSAEGKAIKEDYSWQAKAQWGAKPLLDTPFGAQVTLFHKTKRKQDIDNFFKLVFDSLNRVVWADDNLIEEMIVRKEYDPREPRIEIVLYEITSPCNPH